MLAASHSRSTVIKVGHVVILQSITRVTLIEDLGRDKDMPILSREILLAHHYLLFTPYINFKYE